MSDEAPRPPIRSPELMSRHDTALLVVDMQERLLPAIEDGERIAWNIRRLIDGANVLGVAVAGTEQYPRGLGSTVAPLAERLGELPEKLTFSCLECRAVFDELQSAGRFKVLVSGIEALWGKHTQHQGYSARLHRLPLHYLL